MIIKFLFLSLVLEVFARNHHTCSIQKSFPSYPLLHQAGECGHIVPTPRIMGGTDASLDEFPFMALLLLSYEVGEMGFCDGSVINIRYVLTAAHCTKGVDPYLQIKGFHLIVRLGDFDIDKEIDCDDFECAPPAQDFLVDKIITHELYDPETHINDIAMLRLDRDIVYSRFISPVCLSLDCELINKDLYKKNAILPGWGHFLDAPEIKNTRILQKVRLPITSTKGCSLDWRKDIQDSQICAGGAREHKHASDACKGDSGGPLLYPHTVTNYPLRYFQIGIVSGGDLCNISNVAQRAGIYTRVSSFIPWILDHVEQ